MALDTYANLKTELASWTNRGDLTTPIDTFIDLFEAWANRGLRVRQMEAEANAPASEYLELPADFLEMRDIQFQANPRRQLQYVTPQYADIYDSSGASGTPAFYTLVGNQIRLVPAPDSTTNVRISYWQAIPALSGSQTTNWLLRDYPDVYLYGSLIHARMYIHDPQLAGFIESGWQRAMSEVQSAGKKSNVSASMQIRPA